MPESYVLHGIPELRETEGGRASVTTKKEYFLKGSRARRLRISLILYLPVQGSPLFLYLGFLLYSFWALREPHAMGILVEESYQILVEGFPMRLF